MNTFVDTSGFYAVLDADDDCHQAAKRLWMDLLEKENRLHTSNYVLVETFALLQHRLGMESIRVFTADILPIMDVFWVDEGVHRSAHHAFLISDRRQLSLVDCISFEVMRRLQLEDVFCFDSHFTEQGFHMRPE